MLVMFRVVSAIMPALILSVGTAAASSIISLPAADQAATPSIVMRGSASPEPIDAAVASPAEADTEIIPITPSVAAAGADAIPASAENVSAIPEAEPQEESPAWLSSEGPLGIRDGEIREPDAVAPETPAGEETADLNLAARQ